MMQPSAVHARLVAALEGLPTPTGALSKAPQGFHGIPTSLGEGRGHLAFGVEITKSVPEPVGQRQRQGRPLRMNSEVLVRICHRYRETSDAETDTNAAQDASDLAAIALVGVVGVEVTLTGVQYNGRVRSDLYMVTLTLAARHTVVTQ